MGIEQFHPAKQTWWYVEDGKFSMDFDALESFFNERGLREGLITDKQRVAIRTIEVNPNQRTLDLNIELYRLLEN